MVLDNITFCDFLLFSMCRHLAINIILTANFYIYLYNVQSLKIHQLRTKLHNVQTRARSWLLYNLWPLCFLKHSERVKQLIAFSFWKQFFHCATELVERNWTVDKTLDELQTTFVDLRVVTRALHLVSVLFDKSGFQ